MTVLMAAIFSIFSPAPPAFPQAVQMYAKSFDNDAHEEKFFICMVKKEKRLTFDLIVDSEAWTGKRYDRFSKLFESCATSAISIRDIVSRGGLARIFLRHPSLLPDGVTATRVASVSDFPMHKVLDDFAKCVFSAAPMAVRRFAVAVDIDPQTDPDFLALVPVAQTCAAGKDIRPMDMRTLRALIAPLILVETVNSRQG
ncbi:MAG: hypothetical protein WCO82_00480 [Sphingomonadales bacterium]